MVRGIVSVERAIAIARAVRAELLDCSDTKRNLAGHCGLAAMRVASMLQEPRVLRVGFYMKHETFCGRYGRYPYRHAWCQVNDTIVDLTASQFGHNRAVHVVVAMEEDRYRETASGAEALDMIMIYVCGADLPEYKRLAAQLRRRHR